jgi:hypothetical protein
VTAGRPPAPSHGDAPLSPNGASHFDRANGCEAPQGRSLNFTERGYRKTGARKANRHSNVTAGTRQRSIAAIASAWLRRNVRHVCDGGWCLTTWRKDGEPKPTLVFFVGSEVKEHFIIA